MVFVPSPNVCRIDAIAESQGQLMENTFHYRLAAPATIDELTAICNTYIAWFNAHLGSFSDTLALVKMEGRDLTTESGARITVNVPEGTAGTDASGALPNNVTWAVKRQSGLAGRKNRGRIFWMGLTHDALAPDIQSITPAQASARAAMMDGLQTAQLSDNAATEVILHRSDGTHVDVLNYAYADLFLDSQRRRLPGHNRHH